MTNSESDNYNANCIRCNGNESVCCSTCANLSENIHDKSVASVFSKMNKLLDKITTLESVLRTQNARLGQLESYSGSESYSEPDRGSISNQSENSGGENKSKSYRRQRKKNSESEVFSSKEGDQVASKRKRITRQEFTIKKQERKGAFHEFSTEDESSSSSSSSCSDSGKVQVKNRSRHSYKRKIKSGARVKTRPVVRTELWPHTISNEEDGHNETSESINLAKFLSCFTYILTTCGGLEATGRALLLHGVSTILEYLPWSEARSFHNVVMIKIEQDRIGWNTDFLLLANKFLDKKVRLTLRTRNQTSGYSSHYSSPYRVNSSYTSPNKDRMASIVSDSIHAGVTYSLYSTVCKQWNYSFCYYGERCKKLHVCWTCAEAGNMSEPHKATSHENCSTRDRQDHQYF